MPSQTAQVNGSIGDQAVLIHIASDFGREARGQYEEELRLTFVLFLPITTKEHRMNGVFIKIPSTP